MIAAKLVTISVALLIALVGFSGMAVGAETDIPMTDPPLRQGPAEVFPDGETVSIRFEDGSRFGVHYGTPEEPGPITVFAYQRNLEGLGAVDREFRQRSVVVHRIFFQTFETLLEFQDLNGDGLMDIERRDIGFLVSDLFAHEPVAKGVSLATGWVATEPISTTTATGKVWEVTLTAYELPYRNVGLIPADAREQVLDELSFTFRLSTNQVTTTELVPDLKVEIDVSGEPIAYSETGTGTEVDVIRNRYKIKYDTSISGWDFDPDNTAPRLFLETRAFMGRVMPMPYLIDREHGGNRDLVIEHPEDTTFKNRDRMRMREYLQDHQPGVTAPGDDRLWRDRLLETRDLPMEGEMFRRKALAGERFSLEDGWNSLGELTWVSNVTVDGQDGEVYAQILAHRPARHILPQGAVAVGQQAILGMSYPAGDEILHDPTFEGQALIGLASDDGGRRLPGLVLLAGLMVIGTATVGVAAAGIGAAWNHKRIAKELDETTSAPETDEPDDDDWDVFLD